MQVLTTGRIVVSSDGKSPTVTITGWIRKARGRQHGGLRQTVAACDALTAYSRDATELRLVGSHFARGTGIVHPGQVDFVTMDVDVSH